MVLDRLFAYDADHDWQRRERSEERLGWSVFGCRSLEELLLSCALDKIGDVAGKSERFFAWLDAANDR